MKLTLVAAAAAALLAPLSAATVTMKHVATVNLDSTANAMNAEFIGSNPSGIAWNGTDLFVAGFNNSGATATIGIVKVTGTLGTPVIGAAFGQVSSPPSRGYSGLDVAGGTLAAAYDAGAVDPDGIQGFDLTGAKLWAKSARGGSGVGIDPGFGGVDKGVGWTTFGSGRRALQDSANGADIYTTANGMIILTSQGTFWRDMEYDDATGDIWLREGNNVIHGVRTGGNSIGALTVVYDEPTDADFVAGQNVAFVSRPCQELVFYNTRTGTGLGQPFATAIVAIAPDGTPQTIDWGSFTAASGSGYYDFSYDAATGTMAILDFANRDAHIFEVQPFVDLGGGCAGVGGFTPSLELSGDATPGGVVNVTIANADGGAQAFIVVGLNDCDDAVALAAGFTCTFHPATAPIFIGPLPLGGAGAGNGGVSFAATIPGATPTGFAFEAQALSADGTTGLGFATSNAVAFSVD